MIRHLRRILLVFMAMWPSLLTAQDGSRADIEATGSPLHIDVTIEVHGLEQSTTLLTETMRGLSDALAEMAASPEELTPEQLAAFADLADRTNALVLSLDRTLNGLGPAIRAAEAPTRELLAGLLDTTRSAAIDPTLETIDRRVRVWLLLAILGALLVVGATGLGLYLSTRQLRVMAAVLRSISDDYQIVPRQPLAGGAPAAVPDREAPGDPDPSQ